MRLGRVILSFALALLWLGLPVHCQFEAVSSASLFACADDTDCTSPDQNCADDFCNSLESGNYFPQKGSVAAKAPAAAILPWRCSSELLLPREETFVGTFPRAIPLLGASWQFVQRTAAPPRAPSLLS